jgi:hypothetical protein
MPICLVCKVSHRFRKISPIKQSNRSMYVSEKKAILEILGRQAFHTAPQVHFECRELTNQAFQGVSPSLRRRIRLRRRVLSEVHAVCAA